MKRRQAEYTDDGAALCMTNSRGNRLRKPGGPQGPVPSLAVPPARKRLYDRWSRHLYVYIRPDMVGMFRFFLEAQDNLGYMSVVDRWRAALKITFAPSQEREMRAYLSGMAESLPFEIVDFP